MHIEEKQTVRDRSLTKDSTERHRMKEKTKKSRNIKN